MRAAQATSKMTIVQFLKANPQVSPLVRISDEQLEIVSKIDLGKLSAAITKSGFLKSRGSFNWLITHYDGIIAGCYCDWKRYERPKKKESRGIGSIIEGNTIKSKEFALVHTYTKEEINSFDDIETAEF